MGEANFPTLLGWMLDELKGSAGSVERSGAAQGLAEVLVVLGQERRDAILGEILPLTTHPDPNVREGTLWLLAFLPASLGHEAWSPYLPETFPVIVRGVADEAEYVDFTFYMCCAALFLFLLLVLSSSSSSSSLPRMISYLAVVLIRLFGGRVGVVADPS